MFVLQLEYIQRLITGGILGVMAIAFAVVAVRCFRKACEMESQHADPFLMVLGGAITTVGAIGTGIYSIVSLTNVYTWVGALNPYAAVAIKVMQKVLETAK